MKLLLFIAALVLCVTAEENSSAARSVTVGAKTFYIFNGNDLTYPDAEKFCQSIGYTIAEIANKKENVAVIREIETLGLNGQVGFWIGGRQTFVSSLGLELDFSAWEGLEPNNEGAGKMCVTIYKDNPNPVYHWNDRNCNVFSKVVCQLV